MIRVKGKMCVSYSTVLSEKNTFNAQFVFGKER